MLASIDHNNPGSKCRGIELSLKYVKARTGFETHVYQRSSTNDNWPVVVRVNHLKGAFEGQRSMGTLVIEATELQSEVRFGLQGHLVATMPSVAS